MNKTKMMKKVFITAIAGLICFAGFTQETTVTANSTTFGLRGGVNFQTINGKDFSGNDLDNGITTGINFGVNAEIPVGTGSYFQPGLLFSMKGAEQKNTDNKTKISYIEIPLNFVYKPVLGTGNMLLGFGPYVAFGVGGKVDANGVETDIDFVSDYEASNPSPQLKRFDAGGNLLAGYEFANKFSFQLNAQLGLVNINPEISSSDKTKLRNTGFGVSLGYRF
jgi:hypothetical protein